MKLSISNILLSYCVVLTTLMTYLLFQPKDIVEDNPINITRRLQAGGNPSPGQIYDIRVGGIILWSGSDDTIPSNWALCDGTNGTPDLRDKFVIGAGNLFNVNDIGGQYGITLDIDQLASHNHDHYHPIENNDISVGSNGLHQHGEMSGNSTLSIEPAALDHRHYFTSVSGGAGNHRHRVAMDAVDAVIGGSGLINLPGSNQRPLYTNFDGNHQHSVAGYTQTANFIEGASVDLDISALSTDFEGSHIHSVDGVTGSNTAAYVGIGAEIDVTNPYYSLCYIMKIGNLDNGKSPNRLMANNEISDNNQYNQENTSNDNHNLNYKNILLYILVGFVLISFVCCIFGIRYYQKRKTITSDIKTDNVEEQHEVYDKVEDQDDKIELQFKE